MKYEKPSIKNHDISPEKKIRYFRDLTFEYLPAMRLLFRGGKLWERENWRNVAEHCLVETAAIDAFCDLLGIAREDKERLIKVAACHDWAKRLEKRPQDFSPEEIEKAQQFLRSANPDKEQMKALTFDFFPEWFKGKWSFLQEVQLYVDDICSGNNIVFFQKRIDGSEQRDPQYNEDPKFTEMLGGRYFDKEREFGRKVEEKFFAILKDRGVEIDVPNQIPEIIKQKIEKNIIKHSMEK